MTRKIIRGAGGGKSGSSGRTPVESRDSLRSRAFAKVLDLVCEGEIEGLANGNKSIFFDETPYQDSSGNFNFDGITLVERVGTQGQEYAPGFDSVENEVAVNVEAKYDTDVTRRITDSDIDAVRIRITVPQLTRQDVTNGDLGGSSVDFKIQLQSNGGGFVDVVTDTISGKTTSRYQRTYRIELTGSGPWDVRLKRLTPDSVSVAVQDKLYFEAYTEVIDAKLRYPNSAYIALKVDATQFSNIPRRAYDLKLLKIKVPSNYNPETRVYTGSWDGTFQIAWTDNPAWIFYDLITTSRYGLGSYVQEDQVDKWGLYSIGQYCDVLVDDGYGGLEPRMTCNIYIQTQEEAYKVIQDLASTFRAMTYWASGSVTIVQDAPSDPVYLYTQGNVLDGTFLYSGSSAKVRHTVALVTWNDPEDFYKQKVEYVEDAEAIARYGVITTQVTAVGCTSRGQANRVGRWIIYAETHEKEIVTFKTGIEGAVARPGQIIKIADSMRGGARMGGRISSATINTVTVDSDLVGSLSGTDLSVMLPDGTVETKVVANNTTRVLSVIGTFSQAPNAQSVWILSNNSVEAQLFKIFSVVEQDGLIEISALAHDPRKYDAVENGLILESRSITNLKVSLPAPSGISVTETLFNLNTVVRTRVTLSWDRVDNAVGYFLRYRAQDGNFTVVSEVQNNSFDIDDLLPGPYEFQVSAINSAGKKGQAAVLIQELYGKTLPPSDVSGFSIIPNGNVGILTWNQSVDLDVLSGGWVRIRYTPNTTGQSWNDSVDVVAALAGNQTTAQVPLLSGTYLAKFVDSSGFESEVAAQIVTTVPESLVYNIVQVETEDPTFPGTHEATEYNPSLSGMTLSGNGLFDDIADFDALLSLDFLGDINEAGSYTFQNTVNLLGSHPCRLTARIKVEGFDIANLVDSRLTYIDDWDNFDGDVVSDVNAKLFMRTTEDDPTGSPVWTEWKPFLVGNYQLWGAQFRLDLTTLDSTHNILVRELSVTIDMADRIDDKENLDSGETNPYTYTFNNAFFAVPTIGITPHNLQTGDTWEMSNKTLAGFDIVFKNSSGTVVNRTFDVVAKGYGKLAA